MEAGLLEVMVDQEVDLCRGAKRRHVERTAGCRLRRHVACCERADGHAASDGSLALLAEEAKPCFSVRWFSRADYAEATLLRCDGMVKPGCDREDDLLLVWRQLDPFVDAVVLSVSACRCLGAADQERRCTDG